jgi:dTDP-3-amino-2,3,6-trideoxy-4-keto-D-glucose/dTDP-3-amino-3,4,6-trideoxy-alpha-D-glucose/dTDP-2,6-dideoxy-D-kanosamine transaminase
MIKVWDYKKEYQNEKEEILSAVEKVFESGTLVFGPHLEEFEKKFANYCDCKYGVGVGNCTDALEVALRSLKIGNGDEVITVSNTAVPTVSAIVSAGAIPVFVDVDEHHLMDVPTIEDVITEKTKCILPVHLYGQSVDMDSVARLAQKYNLKIVEDCAQAHGATYKGKKVGSMSDAGAFSFYPTKVLGAYGDGGMITTNSEELGDTLQRVRFYGMEKKKMSSGHWNGKYYSLEHGINSRLDELHAAILLKKLNHLDEYILTRCKIAKRYDNELSSTSMTLPRERRGNKYVYYVYVVKHPKRDLFIEKLREREIHVNISYPWPIHTMAGYEYLGWKEGDLPITERYANEIFSLPMYPTLTSDEQTEVIKAVKEIDKLLM